jgi:hypothetical protein
MIPERKQLKLSKLSILLFVKKDKQQLLDYTGVLKVNVDFQ